MFLKKNKKDNNKKKIENANGLYSNFNFFRYFEFRIKHQF